MKQYVAALQKAMGAANSRLAAVRKRYDGLDGSDLSLRYGDPGEPAWLHPERMAMLRERDQAREALNFAITVSIACFVLLLLTFMTLGIGIFLTLPLLMIIGIGSLIFVIIAAIKANEGTAYRYPVSLRLVK